MNGLEFLAALLVLGAVISAVLVMATHTRDTNAISRRATRKQLVVVHKKFAIAKKALQEIARSGNTLEANVAQKEKNQVSISKYTSLKNCRHSGLSENACLVIYLADAGDIPFYPVPQGSAINVNPSK